MKLPSTTFWVLGMVAAVSFAGVAKAGDFGSADGGKTASQLDQQIEQAAGSAAASTSDVDSRVKDLESTRTAIDQKKPPTVSLSVSGWVSQEVQYNAKQ